MRKYLQSYLGLVAPTVRIMLTLWMPQLVFIDKNGAIRAQFPGTADFFKDEETNMRKMVEKLPKE